jgi:hypothetical protein
MIQRLGIVTLTGATLLLSGCGGAQPISIHPQLIRLDDGDCGGTHGVKVRPCPIRIETKDGIEITVSGPGVTYGSFVTTSTHLIYVTAITHTRLRAFPGDVCGGPGLAFFDGSSAHRLIGTGNLKVSNYYGTGPYCKHH